MKVNKWNYKKHDYDIVELPEEWNIKLMTNNMEEIVNCPHCGEMFEFGIGYTSQEFHTNYGMGYIVCEKCHEEEMKRRYGRK